MKKLQLIAPNTKLTRVGYCCLLLVPPLMAYKVYYRLVGRPIDYQSKTIIILGGLAMFGWIGGFLLLGIATIRFALRDKS